MGILDTDVIVMDQIRFFMSHDCAIHDGQGQVIGSLQTEGGVGSRMLDVEGHPDAADLAQLGGQAARGGDLARGELRQAGLDPGLDGGAG